MNKPVFPSGYERRKTRSQKWAFGIFSLLSYSIVILLFGILGFIIYKGAGVINWKFISGYPADGMTSGGIWPAIVGTFYLMIGSAIFAFPTGIYERDIHERICPKKKINTVHTGYDQ